MIEVLKNESAKERCEIKCKGRIVVVKRDWLGPDDQYDKVTQTYGIRTDNIDAMKKVFGAIFDTKSTVKYLGYCNAKGQACNAKESKAAGDYRLVYFEWPESKHETWWVPNTALDKSQYKELGEKTHKSITKFYKSNPDNFVFTTTNEASTCDAFSDLSESQETTSFDSEGKKWVNVELPFDSQGSYSLFTKYLDLPRPQTKTGWVKLEECKEISPFNWPGFHIAEESGLGSKDAYIDFNNLNPFFKNLLNVIDENNDGIVSHEELKKAHQDPILADRLNRAIVKHPSERQADSELSAWDHIKKWLPTKEEHEATKEHISNLVWWDDVKSLGDSNV